MGLTCALLLPGQVEGEGQLGGGGLGDRGLVCDGAGQARVHRRYSDQRRPLARSVGGGRADQARESAQGRTQRGARGAAPDEVAAARAAEEEQPRTKEDGCVLRRKSQRESREEEERKAVSSHPDDARAQQRHSCRERR
eukprot:1987945-Rhodomonas_salina.4